MKKVLIDARESGTSTGRYVDKLIENLCKLNTNFEIVILTKSTRIEYIRAIAPKFKVIEADFKEFSFSEQNGLLKLINSQKADLVHFGMTQQPIRYKGKTVTTIHDLTTVRFENPIKNRVVFKTKQTVYKAVVKKVAKKSSYIITPSRFVKHDVAQYCKIDQNKIKVIYEAADEIASKAKEISILKNRQFLVYVGRALPHKNLEKLVDAFKIINRTKPELYLFLAGKHDGNYELLREYVVKKSVSNIIFGDFVDDSQLKWLYQNTSAYVFPSLSEGFGLPGLEAMIHGAPVISSGASCLPEIYGSAAQYFDPSDISDIANKILEVIDSPSLQQKLINDGKHRAEKYSWTKTAEQTLEVYKLAIGE